MGGGGSAPVRMGPSAHVVQTSLECTYLHLLVVYRKQLVTLWKNSGSPIII